MRMNPLRSITDPRKRSRMIVWGFVALLGSVVFWAGGIIGTSFEWFCTTPCHMVHDDNTAAYRASTHTNVSCIACHEPPNADPVTMTLMKIKVLPDLPATVLGTFHLPVNATSYLAVEIPDEQCTQCHNLANRAATPADGILIDHAVHTENDVTCATCHNRVAHPEDDIELVLGDRKHDDWMTMDACFRCHSLEEGAKAPGACEACHTPQFALVPASHETTAWYTRFGESGGHASAAREESATVAEAVAFFAKAEPIDEKHAVGPVLGPSSAVNSCLTCHTGAYCTDCHGVPMPHPDGFTENHGAEGRRSPETCGTCHARNAAEAARQDFCNACHHPQSRPGVSWQRTHREAVIAEGSRPCLDCHNPRYCSACHVRGPAAARELMRQEGGS